MCAPKAPKPPDPKETSAAQTGTNVATAVANAYLGNVDQITPDGSLSYDQSGSYSWNDPYTNKTYEIPTFTATQSLSPEQQAIYDLNKTAESNMAGTAADQSGFLRDYLGTPVNIDNAATEARLFELGRTRLDPMFSEQEESLRQRLANQGITLGSKAYDTAMRQFSEGRNDAYNQLLLTGRGQAVQEAFAERNQPINEITALLSGSQVSQPNFVNANMPQVATTDNAGLINANYQQKLAGWQQQQQQQQALMGGLFGLGSAAIMGYPNF